MQSGKSSWTSNVLVRPHLVLATPPCASYHLIIFHHRMCDCNGMIRKWPGHLHREPLTWAGTSRGISSFHCLTSSPPNSHPKPSPSYQTSSPLRWHIEPPSVWSCGKPDGDALQVSKGLQLRNELLVGSRWVHARWVWGPKVPILHQSTSPNHLGGLLLEEPHQCASGTVPKLNQAVHVASASGAISTIWASVSAWTCRTSCRHFHMISSTLGPEDMSGPKKKWVRTTFSQPLDPQLQHTTTISRDIKQSVKCFSCFKIDWCSNAHVCATIETNPSILWPQRHFSARVRSWPGDQVR